MNFTNIDSDLEKIDQIITSCSKILLTTHENPDGDGLGSEVAMYHHLIEIGKDVKIINKILAVDEEKKISTLTEKLEKIENRIKFWDQTIKTVDSSTSLSYLDSIIVKYNIQET